MRQRADQDMTPDEIREAVRKQYGDGTDLPRTAEEKVSLKSRKKTNRSSAELSAAASKRAKTGSKFEDQLEDTHAGMARDGLGLVLRQHVPTRRVSAQKIIPVGHAPCDFLGHVNAPIRAESIPVAFDAKVLDSDHATYRHDPKLQHQLHSLKLAHENGSAAFLLVRASAVDRVFVIRFGTYFFQQLLRGDGVKLYEQEQQGTREERRLGAVTRVPVYRLIPHQPSVAYTPGKGWLWAPLITGN